jgi:hypothetical protein
MNEITLNETQFAAFVNANRNTRGRRLRSHDFRS